MSPFMDMAAGLILEGVSPHFRPRSAGRFGARGRGLLISGDL
jgi:hypothetical protein